VARDCRSLLHLIDQSRDRRNQLQMSLTLERRKLEFACEAIQSVEVMRLGSTDQGSLQADIGEYLRATRAVLRHPLVRRIIPDLIAERLRSNELSTMLDGIAEARRQFGYRLLDRAIARNDGAQTSTGS
jgi:hypothetical protein